MHIRLLTLCVLVLFLLASPATAADLGTMVGQMLMAGFRGTEITADSPIARDIRDRHLGGVILFDYDVALDSPVRNIERPSQVIRLTAALQSFSPIPLFIGVDQEGGKVQRLKPARGFVGIPSAKRLGKKQDKLVRANASMIGATLAGAGFNLDFAPVVDVDINPDSPAIGRLERSFSSDPKRVARCAELFLEGLAGTGVIGCLKHFPGHGSAGSDSHLGLTDVTDTWQAKELLPYRELVAEGKARMIMTAHIVNRNLDPDHPATLSKKIITGILREGIGFDGVVVTDDMNMKAIAAHYGLEEAIRLAIEAGADILLFGNNLDYDPDIVIKAHAIIMELVEQGAIPAERIEQSHARIMRLKKGLTR